MVILLIWEILVVACPGRDSVAREGRSAQGTHGKDCRDASHTWSPKAALLWLPFKPVFPSHSTLNIYSQP